MAFRRVEKNVTPSLNAQSVPARGRERIMKGSVKANPDVNVPGVRGVEDAVGKRHERSAAEYGDKMTIK